MSTVESVELAGRGQLAADPVELSMRLLAARGCFRPIRRLEAAAPGKLRLDVLAFNEAREEYLFVIATRRAQIFQALLNLLSSDLAAELARDGVRFECHVWSACPRGLVAEVIAFTPDDWK